MAERSWLIGVVLAVVVAATLTVGDRARTDMAFPSLQRVIATPLPTPIAEIPPAEPTPDHIRDIQERLLELGFWLPERNGVLDEATEHAVTALQKVAGLERDGTLDEATLSVIQDGPEVGVQSTEGRVVEVDLARQVVILVEDGRVLWVLDTSTGKATTPTVRGTHRISRQIDGLRISKWGALWRPKYFYRGQALHGYPSVPAGPASHGCVRLTNAAIDWIWAEDLMPVGTPVWVY